MPCRNLRFLVVEDHEFQRRCLAQLLTGLGATAVHTAQDGQAALDLIARCEHRIDIVICDVTMPGMDGLEFIRRWSERGDPASLILLSAIGAELLNSVGNMATAYGTRLLGTLCKPATAAKLTPLIELHRSTALPDVQGSEFSFQELTRLLMGDEFECWFEPQISLRSARVRGMSALPRWRHPIQGVIGPDGFMPALHAAGLADDLAWLLLQRAAAQCRRWHRKREGLLVSVPLTFASLAREDLAARLQEIVLHETMDPRAMVLTVDEPVLGGTQEARLLENLTRLRLMGFGLAVNDFGARWMEVDKPALATFTELRIKSALVGGVHRNESARAGLAVALDTAERLSVRSVATGIASKEEWTLLHSWGCGYGEGPFIAPPMVEDDVLAWLHRWQSGHLLRA